MLGLAVTLVFSAVASGGTAGAASASGAADEPGINARTSRGQTEVRIKGFDDGDRATIRLRHRGGHPTTLDTKSDKNCAEFSDGGVRAFFRKHQCVSLHRTLIEYREGDYVVRFLIATIDMPDRKNAEDLQKLLCQGSGSITPLRGQYRHILFTEHPHTTLHGTTVISTQVQPVGRTPGAEVLASLGRGVLFSLGIG